MGDFLYSILGGFCGQDPAHTFCSFGCGLGLCARCFGIYMGILTSYFVFFTKRKSVPGHFVYFLTAVAFNIAYFFISRSFDLPYNRIVIFILGSFAGYGLGMSAFFNLFGRYKSYYGISITETVIPPVISLLFLVFYFISGGEFLFNMLFVLILTSILILIFAGIFKAVFRNPLAVWVVSSAASLGFIILAVILFS